MTETIKDLLRPLRNALLSSSSPKEALWQTSKERETERNLARIKGFTYLKSIDELLIFNPSLEDPIQRSNIPLLSRPSTMRDDERRGKAKTMVVHDFGSAYHDYEANNQCIGIDEAQFSLDNGHLQYVETFVYFAHYLVSCPPASWVSLCHGNGVRCLGTFIIEPQMLKEEVGKVFKRDIEGRFEVAEMLGRIARWVGFEGWIVNIEGVFADEMWDSSLMVEFLKELRKKGMVVWYDALTTSNKINHQNALTPSNLPFVLAAGHLLTNYAWSPSKIVSSISLASQHGIDPSNLYFGIDIWAQNRPHSFFHPRLTWPIFNGGGTNTGFAVSKCAEMGVSAGLFAPGWCWEHFRSTTDRKVVESAMWRGEELRGDVKCDCKGGFWGEGNVHRTELYRDFPIVRSAREFVSGTEKGFWTGFERAIVGHDGNLDEFYGSCRMHAQLGGQGIMPVLVEDEEKEIWWNMSDAQPGRLGIIAAKSSGADSSQRYVKLYNLGIRVEKHTRLMVRYRCPQTGESISAGLLIKFHSSLGESQEFVQLLAEETSSFPLSETFSHELSPILGEDSTITELGGTITGALSNEQEVLQITNISIGLPSSFPANEGEIYIINIEITIKGQSQWKHGRLTWELHGVPGRQNDWWSERTGPIAYFDVGIDGVTIGRAYGLEFVVPDCVLKRWQGEVGVLVVLVGVLYGGARMTKTQARLKDSNVFENERDQ